VTVSLLRLKRLRPRNVYESPRCWEGRMSQDRSRKKKVGTASLIAHVQMKRMAKRSSYNKVATSGPSAATCVCSSQPTLRMAPLSS
jgi:hypothetical protein